MSSYSIVDTAYIRGGAYVIDRNSSDHYLPPRVILAKVDATGHYDLEISFSGDDTHNLWSLKDDGAFVSLNSHQRSDGSYKYTPDDAVGLGESLASAHSVTKRMRVYLEKGWYTMVASLPDSYGKDSKCFVTACLIPNFTDGDMHNKDSDSLLWKKSTGGGLRIARIENFTSSKDSMPSSCTEFHYDGGQLLLPMYFGEFWTKAVFNHDVFGKDKQYGGYTLSSSSLAFTGTFTSSMCPGTVGYSKVTRNDYGAGGKLERSTVSNFSNRPAGRKLAALFQFDDFDDGELLSQSVLDGNDTLRTTENTYVHEKKPFTCNIHFTDRSINDPCLVQHRTDVDEFCRYHSTVYSYYRIWNRLAKSVTTDHTAVGKVSTPHEYAYDEGNYMVSVDKTISSVKNQYYTTTYKYPCDYPDNGTLSKMTSDNVVSPVIEQILSCNGKELRHIKTLYGLRTYSNGTRRYYPTALQSSQGGNALETRLSYSNYDKFLNPLSFVKDGTDKVTWLWSYNHTYPVAEIRGMTFEEVAAAAGSSGLDNLAGNTKPRGADLKAIRDKVCASGKPVLMTYCLYESGVGINEAAAPNGCKTTYEYDSFGRLSAMYDNDGRTVATHTYQYKSGDNHILTETMLNGSGSQRIADLQYYDGLGRPVQTTSSGIGGKGNYVSTVQGYEGLNRIRRRWLPVNEGGSPGQIWNTDVKTFASSTYNKDNHAYSDNTYDALDRITRTTTPGDAWHSAGKSVTKEYITNGASDVKLYTAPMDGENHLVKSGYYAKCTLFGEKTTDEDGHTLTIFTDKLGRKVHERRASDEGNNDTYFVLKFPTCSKSL